MIIPHISSKGIIKLTLLVFSVLVLTTVFSQQAFASYDDMSARLPDNDSQLFFPPPNNASPAFPPILCANPEAPVNPEFHKYGKWGCNVRDGDYWKGFPENHQYITISNGSINNDLADDYKPHKSVEFVIYTRTPGAKNINLIPVNRSLGQGATNHRLGEHLSCYNHIKVNYHDGNGGFNRTAFDKYTPRCNQDIGLPDFPNIFTEMKDAASRPTGVWRAYISVHFSPPNVNVIIGSQTSFTLGTTSGAKLGYNSKSPAGVSPPAPSLQEVAPDDHGWVNTYPTGLGKYHKVRYYFRPECTTPNNTQFSLAWDDLDQFNDRIQYQQQGVTAKLWKYRDNPNQKTLVREYNFINSPSPVEFHGQHTENYEGRPFAYMFEFENISGGNGISFRYPFDSGNARIPCPPTTTGDGECMPGVPVGDRRCHEPGNVCYNFEYHDPGVFDRDGNPNTTHDNHGAYSEITIDAWDPIAGRQAARGDRFGVFANPGKHLYKYRPDKRTVTISIKRVYFDGANWHTLVDTTDTYTCFNVSCEIVNVYGTLGNRVKKNEEFSVKVRLTNNSPGGPGSAGPVSGPLWINDPWEHWMRFDNPADPFRLGIRGSVGDRRSDQGSIPPGGSIEVDVGGLRADIGGDGPGNKRVEFTAKYLGTGFDLGDTCSKDVPVYVPFNLSVTAVSDPNSLEDPEKVDYSTYVTSDAPVPVHATTKNRFYKLAAGGGETTYASHNDGAGGPGTYNKGRNYTLGPATHIPAGFQAGDQYCSYISIDYTDGYIGPGGPGDIADPRNADESKDCPTIRNRPFFKAYGSSLSAGGDFRDDNDSNTCTGTGKLAGWFNSNYSSAGYGYGSSTQLSALALVQIVGVASAQTTPARSPVDLTFANSEGYQKDEYSSALGGLFGGDDHCLTAFKADDQSAPAATTSVPALGEGTHTIDGNVILTGGQVGNKSVKIFVNGDVYINDSIAYNLAGWTRERVPLVVIQATGNIYIAPGVTRLDGVYVAKKDGDNKRGTIYTCAKIEAGKFKPMLKEELYGGCKNQLTVHGSFLARKVNLMRTYGSLRDERPTVVKTPEQMGKSNEGLEWRKDGSKPVSKNCVTVTEADDDNWRGQTAPTLCVDKASKVRLFWAENAGKKSAQDRAAEAGLASPNCTVWNIPEFYFGQANGKNYPGGKKAYEDAKNTWDNNYLCTSAKDIYLKIGNSSGALYDNNTEECNPVDGPYGAIADPQGGGQGRAALVCTPRTNIIISPEVTQLTPPTSFNCENAGETSFSRVPTCAAEVFDFSPEVYLIELPRPDGSGKRTIKYEAITSLPPVL